MTNYLKNHSNFSLADYTHLTGKGYTNREIKAIWDRDKAEGKGPCGETVVTPQGTWMKSFY